MSRWCSGRGKGHVAVAAKAVGAECLKLAPIDDLEYRVVRFHVLGNAVPLRTRNRPEDSPQIFDPHLAVLITAHISFCQHALSKTQDRPSITGRPLWKEDHWPLFLSPSLFQSLVHACRRHSSNQRELTRSTQHLPEWNGDVAQKRRLRQGLVGRDIGGSGTCRATEFGGRRTGRSGGERRERSFISEDWEEESGRVACLVVDYIDVGGVV